MRNVIESYPDHTCISKDLNVRAVTFGKFRVWPSLRAFESRSNTSVVVGISAAHNPSPGNNLHLDSVLPSGNWATGAGLLPALCSNKECIVWASWKMATRLGGAFVACPSVQGFCVFVG